MFANIFLLITLIALAILGLAVILNNPRRATNRLLFGFILCSAAWILTNLFANIASTDQAALFWSRLAVVPATVVAYDFLLFSHYFPRKTRISPLAHVLYLLPVFASLIFEPTNLNAVSIAAGQDNLKVGLLYYLLVAYFFVAFTTGSWRLSRLAKTSSGLEKAQIRYILTGVILTVVPSLLISGILPLFGVYGLLDVSPAAVLIFVVMSSIAIFRHRLLEIRVIVARSIAYTLLLTFLGFIYGLAAYLLGGMIFHGSSISTAQQVYNVVLALVLAFTFQPLRRFFQKATDRVFYRDRYDSQEVLNRFTSVMVSELHLDHIMKRALTELCDSLHVQFGQLIIFNADRVYKIEHYGPLPKRLMIAPELRRLNKHMLIADELDGGERKHILETHGIRVSMLLSTREDFVGYLLLGDKLSGDIYSRQDVELLEIIRGELAVAIQNAKAYTEIQAFNVTLQARVDHATNRLRVANRHLQELDKAKDEFISMASHQLRTPLTTIKGYLSMMLEGDVGKVSADQAQFIRYAFDASERMVNLISDLLNVSRMSAGRFLIQTKPTDMVQMIDDEVRQLTPHARAKNIGLTFEHPKQQLPLIEIDDNKTRQVIMNFIDNAIYYTSKGDVRVTLQQTGDHVTLRVKDTGIGVPEEAKKQLFTKFFRAGNAQSVRPDGTGLGLYLAKRVIEDQGGTIIFESAEGKGSTFGFELPLKPPPAPRKDKDKDKVKEKTHAR